MPAWFLPVLNLINNILSLVGLTATAQQANDIQMRVAGMQGVVTRMAAELLDPTNGLQAIRNAVDTNAALATIQYNDLVTRVGTRQQSGIAVTLPATAPSGYGGTDAAGVWTYTVPGSTRTTGYQQVTAGAYGVLASAGTVRPLPMISNGEGWTFVGDFYNDSESGPSLGLLDPVKLSSILETDASYAAWLTRICPSMALLFDQERAYINQPGGSMSLYCAYTVADFQMYQALVLGVGSHHKPTAPVWPGLANVTLGSTRALAPALSVTEPMDGVIIRLTSLPNPKGFYAYDDQKSYLNIGGLAFVDDADQVEWFQALGFTSAIYTPRLMYRAAAVKIRCAPGVVGTVQPWTVT